MTVYLIVDLVCHNFDFPSYDLTAIIFFFYVIIMTIYLIVDLTAIIFFFYVIIMTIYLIVDLVS